MEHSVVFTTLETECVKAISALSDNVSLIPNEATAQLLATLRRVYEHGHAIEALVSGFSAVYHHYDFDPETPANGYRSLVKVQFNQMLLCQLFFVL